MESVEMSIYTVRDSVDFLKKLQQAGSRLVVVLFETTNQKKIIFEVFLSLARTYHDVVFLKVPVARNLDIHVNGTRMVTAREAGISPTPSFVLYNNMRFQYRIDCVNLLISFAELILKYK